MPASPYVSRIIELTNQHRVANGCPPVTENGYLNSAAQGHSVDMALNDFFSHTGSDGSNPGQRITAAGYAWSTYGENIATGQATPEEAISTWMGSAGHRANILNCAFQDIGVGYYYLQSDGGAWPWKHYWTQVFASP
jgi:uncharacterized protein YkwD